MSDICPYKILDIHTNCSIEELKARFKHLAIKYHPDKGGDKNIFNLMVNCYKKVFKDIKMKDDEKDYTQLKQHAHVSLNPKENSYVVAKEDFNDKFNKFFNDNKTKDENVERGYTSFMNSPDVKLSDKHYKVSKYKEPEGNVHSKLQFHELGEKVRDFSGKNHNMHELQYMDYQYAHTTSKLIEPSLVEEREDFKSMDDIKKKRSEVNFNLTDRDKKYYDNIKLRKDKKEQKRIDNINQYNIYLEKHNKSLNNLIV
jgi:hypothetical protein